MNLLLVAGFGAAGACARYGVDRLFANNVDSDFPWGTLAVNVSGSFLLGILVALTTERLGVSEEWRIALGVGFLGSFTTFSTYAYDSIRLAEDSSATLALLNVFGMVALGLLAAGAGLLAGRAIA